MDGSYSPVRLFASDIDDTILGDAAAAEQFRLTWESLDADQRPLLVYNTARSIGDTRWLLLDRRIPEPEFIIGGLGTEMHDPVDAHAAEEFRASIAAGWNRSEVERVVEAIPGVRRRAQDFPNPCRSSWHWPCATHGDIARAELLLRKVGLDVAVNYTGGMCLDIIPRGAGKGNALAWLCRRIAVPLDAVLVAGASGDNSSMFALAGVRGILVPNASRELFVGTGPFKPLITRKKMAEGVLAGLEHFGIFERVVSPAVHA